MSTVSKTQRQLDLLAYLVGRRFPVPVEELMERIPAYAGKWVDGEDRARASVRRTFERDKDDLRGVGIPLETVKYTVNYGAEEVEGYRVTRRDFYLPYLRLAARAAGTGASAGAGAGAGGGSDPRAAEESGASSAPRRGDSMKVEEVEIAEDEAGLALDALRRVGDVPAFPLASEAGSAFRKLAFDLDPEAFRATPILQVERPGAQEIAATLRVLSDALLARKRVRFRYHGLYRGETTQRDVAGYGLLFQRGHWYLIGSDALRDGAMRTFRVARMEEPRPETRRPNTPDYEVPADFSLDEQRGLQAWELGGEEGGVVRAEVSFRFPLSLWVARNGLGEALREGDDGSATRVFDVVQVDPFLRWLLSLAGGAEVEAPPELAVALRDLAGDVARKHAGGSDAADGDGASREQAGTELGDA